VIADGVLRAAVDRGVREHDVPGHGRQVDELAVALLLHDGQHRGDPVEDGLDVDVDDLLPPVDLEGLERGQRHQPGVVDDDVDAAERADRGVDEGLHLLAGGDVHDLVGGVLAEVLGDRLEVVLGRACEFRFSGE
jgi:hypothetical protein